MTSYQASRLATEAKVNCNVTFDPVEVEIDESM